jgi:hypothetical protein
MKVLSRSDLESPLSPSPVRNPALARQLSRLRQLIDRTGLATQEVELQGHWGKYLCVVAAGFLENGLQIIYSDFAARSASVHVARYVSERLAGVSNPNAQRFIDVAGAFNPGWREELEEYLNADAPSRKDALDSIMNNRNQISHGGNVGISVHRVRDYLNRCVEVLEFIEDQCDGRDRN